MGTRTNRRSFLRASAAAAAGAMVAGSGFAIRVPAALGQVALKDPASLADQVKAGKLPPIDQRLPGNPRVLQPLESVGQHGGVWHRAYKGLSDYVGPSKLNEQMLIKWDAPNPSSLGLVANFVEKWETNADATEWTWYFRDGVKWSDGTAVSTDDIRFWWDDIQMNKDITPNPNFLVRQRVNGEFVNAKLEITGKNSWKVSYAAPNPLLPILIAKQNGGVGPDPGFFAPSAYLKQFHPTYTDVNKLNAMAADKKLQGWQQLWGTAGNMQGPGPFWFVNPDKPVLSPWRTTSPAPNDPHVMERNPFFWQVDPQGNQLPYIDRIEHAFFDNQEVLNLWVAQGKIDEQGRHMSTGSYTFYKENEAKGGYRTFRWRSASVNTYFPNETGPDPVLSNLFRMPEVREALNLAINREEVNQTIWNGLGRARQAAPVNGSPEFDPEMETRWAEYNPDRANQLLDSVGLTKGQDGIRRRPDGKPFEFIMLHTSTPGSPDLDQHEFVRRYWEAIGVRVTMQYVERGLYDDNNRKGDMDAGYWGFDRLSVIKADPGRWTAQIQDGPWAPRWGNFYGNAPYTQEEPPADHPIRQIWAAWDQTQVTADEAQRNAIFQSIISIHKQAPFVVGVVGELVAPFIVKNNFRNFLDGYIADDTLRDDGLLNPAQFFFQR